MKLTNQQLKQIIREELQNVLSEGPMGDAQKKIRSSGEAKQNIFLQGFLTLTMLSGPGRDSLIAWTSNAEHEAEKGNSDASEALNVVRNLMRG